MKRRRIVVLGGSGFVGRHVVSQLVNQDQEVVVPTRRLSRAMHLSIFPRVELFELDVLDVAALTGVARGADAVINLVGILNQSSRVSFEDAHVKVTEVALESCRRNGTGRYLHMSALNADASGPSAYLRTKGEAEARVATSGLAWTIFQPSVIFGQEDRFLNVFARLSGILPVVFLAGAKARFQPVFVGDVAAAITAALDDDHCISMRYQLCGPRIYTLRELFLFAAHSNGHRPLVVGLPDAVAQIQAWVLEHLPGQLLTRDNLASMRVDNVCNGPFPPNFKTPAAMEDIVPGYMRQTQADPLAVFRQRNH